MKKSILLLFLMSLTVATMAQKLSKEELEAKVDTLTQENASLVAQNDELTKKLAPMVAVYDSLKAGYFKADYAAKDVRPTLDALIKSAGSSTDSLVAANAALQAKITHLTTGADAVQKEKDQVVKDLQQAKELLDAGILTEEEFQAIKKKYISKL